MMIRKLSSSLVDERRSIINFIDSDQPQPRPLAGANQHSAHVAQPHDPQWPASLPTPPRNTGSSSRSRRGETPHRTQDHHSSQGRGQPSAPTQNLSQGSAQPPAVQVSEPSAPAVPPHNTKVQWTAGGSQPATWNQHSLPQQSSAPGYPDSRSSMETMETASSGFTIHSAHSLSPAGCPARGDSPYLGYTQTLPGRRSDSTLSTSDNQSQSSLTGSQGHGQPSAGQHIHRPTQWSGPPSASRHGYHPSQGSMPLSTAGQHGHYPSQGPPTQHPGQHQHQDSFASSATHSSGGTPYYTSHRSSTDSNDHYNDQ